MKTGKPQVKPLHPQLAKLDQKLRKAADLYEEQFLRKMVQAMRNSVSHSQLTRPSMAENIFREKLDDQTVNNWVKQGGIGFGDMIYQDLVEKFYPQLGGRKPKQLRPVDISDRFQGISRSASSPQLEKHTFNLQLAPQKASKSYLQVPWQGKLEKQFTLHNGDQVAMFSHPFGLKSTFVFRGQVQPGLLNKTLNEGEDFAQLSPQSQNMTWQIERINSRKDPSEGENASFN
jgi:Rod binding domain-containing protein